MKKQKTVWLLTTEWTYDGESGGDSYVFSTYSKAEKQFLKECADARRDYKHISDLEEESGNTCDSIYFNCFESGHWNDNHCHITLAIVPVL